MKWAIFGAGNISNQFCENLLELKDAKIYSIASKNPNKLNAFGDKYKINISNRFNNYDDILSVNFDIAYIGLINSLHDKIINSLIIKNKNILAEKPCFLSIEDFDKNINLIKKHNILFVESMMNLHHPQTSKIIDFINDGKIGSLVSFEHKFGFDIRKRYLKFFKKKINELNRFTDPKLDGGAINDLGCYGVSFSNKLAAISGSDEIIDTKKTNQYSQTGVDENSKIEIKYKNNFTSYLQVAINENLGCEAKIIGTKGKIIIPNLVKPDQSFKIYLIQNKTLEYNFKANKLYTYVAEDMHRYIKNNIKEADGHGLKLQDIKKNILILDLWKKRDEI